MPVHSYLSVANVPFPPSTCSVSSDNPKASCGSADHSTVSVLRAAKPSATAAAATTFAGSLVGAPSCCATCENVPAGTDTGATDDHLFREGEHLSKHLPQAKLARGSKAHIIDVRERQDRQHRPDNSKVRRVIGHRIPPACAHYLPCCLQENIWPMGRGRRDGQKARVVDREHPSPQQGLQFAGPQVRGSGLGMLPLGECEQSQASRDGGLCTTSCNCSPPEASGGRHAADLVLSPRGNAPGEIP